MKTILLSLALVASFAHAAPPTAEQRSFIAHMVKECRAPMGKAVCRVENENGGLTTAASCLQAYEGGLVVAGVGKFSGSEYCEYVVAGKRMCTVIAKNCTADYDGRGCLMARALWRQR